MTIDEFQRSVGPLADDLPAKERIETALLATIAAWGAICDHIEGNRLGEPIIDRPHLQLAVGECLRGLARLANAAGVNMAQALGAKTIEDFQRSHREFYMPDVAMSIALATAGRIMGEAAGALGRHILDIEAFEYQAMSGTIKGMASLIRRVCNLLLVDMDSATHTYPQIQNGANQRRF